MADQIIMEQVLSSNIDAMGHDPKTRTLRVRFSAGGTYDYEDVDDGMFSALSSASSIGGHLHKHIKPNCACIRCPD